MTLQERLQSAQAEMGQLYLRREHLQTQLQQLQGQARGLEVALIAKDGEVGLLRALIADEKAAG